MCGAKCEVFISGVCSMLLDVEGAGGRRGGGCGGLSAAAIIPIHYL